MLERLRAHPMIARLTALYIVAWTAIGLTRGSPLAIPYLLEMVALTTLVLVLDRRRPFSTGILAGLSLWGFLHMAGGMTPVGDSTLYETWILPVLRWDQLVHAVGFGFAGVAVFEVFMPWLVSPPRPAAAAWLAFLGSAAIGAINEAVEFLASQLLPFANVGDATNTGLDLIANSVGGAAAAFVSYRRAGSAAGDVSRE
ncbi:MAG: DUF2238 domain-containing protein [Acidimicrobiia bacterium]|nr:DUF2238 domain-containing protein [Acidimicrobiia bacterium]MDH4306009.1 DUF2238 domain-containing protein [Acidimicrobiia bacterium]MDH5292196.1 DUF2238 domain-containing protein [Acidimicrobiia bacterium]MDH5521914.1 DUF2238 domain-containing protein [Acidimicrobiia bacterium]